MHELIPPDSAMDPLVTSQFDVRCKQKKCLTSYGEAPRSVQMPFRSPNTLCCPVVNDNVLIVAVR